MPERSEGPGEANFLLSLLDEDIRREVLAACMPVKLALGNKLVFVGTPIEHALFLSSGIASIVVVSTSGRKTEAGIVGNEGFVPAGVLAGAETSFTEIVVQARESPGDRYAVLPRADCKTLRPARIENAGGMHGCGQRHLHGQPTSRSLAVDVSRPGEGRPASTDA
jgi:hypothetical protein